MQRHQYPLLSFLRNLGIFRRHPQWRCALQRLRFGKAEIAAAAAYAANNSKDGDEYQSLRKRHVQLGGSISSVQRFCEFSALLFIVIAFVVVGVMAARRVSSRLLAVDAGSYTAATGRALRLQMVGTTAFVFVAFLIRSVLSTMSAVAFELRNFDDKSQKCPVIESSTYCGALCQNMYTHMVGWLNYTPEFQSTIVLVSSPVALLVALWGMTSNATLHLMKFGGQGSNAPITIA